MAIIKRFVHIWCDLQTLMGDDLRFRHYFRIDSETNRLKPSWVEQREGKMLSKEALWDGTIHPRIVILLQCDKFYVLSR
jgi:hypothetical protein